jgi:hypothetical protein
MPSLPLPPVPQRLREMLAEYPGHIERLQEALNTVIEKPSKATPPFEVAIWVLESRLGTFITEARDQLKAAEASGDAEAVTRAKQAELLMSKARSVNGGMSDLSDLWAFFEQRKGH